MNRHHRTIVAGATAALLALSAGFGIATRTSDVQAAGAASASAANASAPQPDGARSNMAAILASSAASATAGPADAERPAARYALLADEASDRRWCDLPDDTAERIAAASAKAASSSASSSASAPDSVPAPAQARADAAPAPPAQQLNDGAERVRVAWIERLRGRGDERSLSVADYLETDEDRTEVCRRMVQRARVSADGFVHALAWTRCAATPAGRELDARQWARADPGNQQPWLYEMQRADQAKDGQALAEALHQMSLARRLESYNAELLRQLLGFVQAPDRGLTQSAEYSVAVGTWAAWPIPAYKPLVRSCSSPLLDANRTQTCMAITDRMWTQGGELITLAIAQSMAKRLPYASEELQSRQRVLDELKATAASDADRGAALPRGNCFVTAEMRPWLEAVAEHGEAEALRRKRALKR